MKRLPSAGRGRHLRTPALGQHLLAGALSWVTAGGALAQDVAPAPVPPAAIGAPSPAVAPTLPVPDTRSPTAAATRTPAAPDVVEADLQPAAVAAQNAAGPPPLTLPAVLQSVQEHHPKLRAAEQEVIAARGGRMAARGGFDPKLKLGVKRNAMGYYKNHQVMAEVQQPTPVWGTELYAGYRLGRGEYPVYKGELETLSGGELSAGLQVPLWRGGPIDKRRAELRTSRLERKAADCQLRAELLDLQQQAAHAYYGWVEAGQQVRIAEALLAVAEGRDASIRARVAAGAAAPVIATDNARLVLDRRGKLLSAQRKYRRAVLKLSLYLRDAQGQPLEVSAARLPVALPAVGDAAAAIATDAVDNALRDRPELCMLRLKAQSAGVKLRLSDNQVAPHIAAGAEVSRDLGDGKESLQGTELAVSLTVEMPLGLRKARGGLAQARAQVAAIDSKLRYLSDTIGTEVEQAEVDLRVAQQQAALAAQQLAVAETLADAERERFSQGASDLVVVNLREIAAADAARQHIEAQAAYQRAWVDYLTALGQWVSSPP